MVADSSIAIRLVALAYGDAGTGWRLAAEFAEAFLSDDVYREVDAAVMADVDEPGGGEFRQVSRPRLSDVHVARLDNAEGRLHGFNLAASPWAAFGATKSTTQAERGLAVLYVDLTSATVRVPEYPMFAHWRLEQDRTPPLWIYLDMETSGAYRVALSGGRAGDMSPEQAAAAVWAAPAFRTALAGAVRPALNVVTRYNGPEAAQLSENERFLTELGKLAGGRWESSSYTGKAAFSSFGQLIVDGASPFSHQATPVGDVEVFHSGSVFGFPSADGAWSRTEMAAFAEQVRQGAVRSAEWGDADPVFVLASGNALNTRVSHKGGFTTEESGYWAASALIANNEYAGLMTSDPQPIAAWERPIVLISPNGGDRARPGGLGFDFASALHTVARDYRRVFAVAAPAGLRWDNDRPPAISLVSVPRDGDLDLLPVTGPDGTPRALLVRSPGDEQLVSQVQQWATASTNETLRSVTLPDGVALAPWHGSQRMPVFLVAKRSETGYLGQARGLPAAVTPKELTDVLRDSEALRSLLGRGTAGADLARGQEPSIVLAPVGGPALGRPALVAGLASGGYSRTIHSTDGEFRFVPDGTVAATEPRFVSVPPPDPAADQVLSYPLTTKDGDVIGQTFPSEDADAAKDAWSAATSSPRSREHYVQHRIDKTNRDPLNIEVTMLAPRSEDSWRVVSHGLPQGMIVALRTGFLHGRGDYVTMTGSLAARMLNSELFQKTHPERTPWLEFDVCWLNKPYVPGGKSSALSIVEAWNRDLPHRPVPGAIAANNILDLFYRGSRAVLDNGVLAEAGKATDDWIPVPAADLTARSIDTVRLSDAEAGSVPAGRLDALVEIARKTARAAAGSARLGAGTPPPSITVAFGRGAATMAALAETRIRTAVAEEAGLLAARYGLPFDPATVPIRKIATEDGDLAGTVEVQVNLVDGVKGQRQGVRTSSERAEQGSASVPEEPILVAGETPGAAPAPSSPRPPRIDAPELVIDTPSAGGIAGFQQTRALSELARYLAEQSVLRRRRGFTPPMVELGVRAGTGPAESIRQRLSDLVTEHTSRHAPEAVPGPVIRLAHRPDAAPGTVQLRVDWELRGAGLLARPSVETTSPATPLTITTDLPPLKHPVLDDPAWRHSTAATAEWMIDPAPLTRAELDAARDGTTPVTVAAEDVGPQVLDPRSGAATGQWRHPIAYDYRRYEARPGKWVQDYTVRLRFTALDGSDVPHYAERAQAALDRVYNHRYLVPTGDAFHFRVLHDPSGAAHDTVTIGTPGSKADQLRWPADIHELTIAHELGHFAGLHDEYVRHDGAGAAWALRGPGSSRVISDDGLFTRHLADYLKEVRTQGDTDLPVPSVKPRNLWLVEHRARTLGATIGVSTGRPVDATPPDPSAGTTLGDGHDSLARLTTLVAQAKRHLAVLPESFEPELRTRVAEQGAGLGRITSQGLAPGDVTGLPARVAELEQVVAELRDHRLRQATALHEAATAAIDRGENPLRFHLAGVPGGVTSRPDARFGLEIELQLHGERFEQQSGRLGSLLEANGIIEWDGGVRFEDVETDPTRWTFVEEPDLDDGAELRSPILPGNAESWREVERALRVIRSHRNVDGDPPDVGRVGGHVNVSFDRRPDLAAYGRLAQLAKVFEDVLYRLGNHPGPDARSRLLQPVGPNPLPLALADITTADDVQALNTTKHEAVSYRHVYGEPEDRVEFRFWAGGLAETGVQVAAEISGSMLLAAADPAIDGRLRELITQPRLVGHTPVFPSLKDELAYLLDLLELLPLSRAAEELVVSQYAQTRPLSVTDGNDPQLVAQTVVGPGGRGWLFPVRGTGISEALHLTASLPRYPGAEVVAATLTSGLDAIDLWTSAPVSVAAFSEVLRSRNPVFSVPESDLPPGVSPRLVLAVPSGATKLGTAVSNAIDEPVVATEGQVRVTEDGKLWTDDEWVALVSGSVWLRTGQSDLGMALAILTAMDPSHDESPAAEPFVPAPGNGSAWIGEPSAGAPVEALPEAPDSSLLPEIVLDPRSFTEQVLAGFDSRWHAGERTGAAALRPRSEGDVTAVVGPAGIPALTVSFAETAAALTAGELAALRETAHAIAQAAALRSKWELPGLSITTTAYGGRDPQQRAAQVRALLRRALAEELALEGSGSVRVEDIAIHAEAGFGPEGTPPEGRQQVVVETSVAVTRPAAEQLTVEAYDMATRGLHGLRLPRAEIETRLSEYGELAIGGRLEHHPLPTATRAQLLALNENLAVLADAEARNRVRALVNEAVLSASLVPAREQVLKPQSGARGVPVDRRVIQPITPARLTQLLDELNHHVARSEDPTRTPTSPVAGTTIASGDHLAARLAALGLINLSASSRTIVTGDPLYQALLRNPAALTEALFAGTGHEEQRFLNTSVPAAIDAAVRGRVPTIAALLHIGRAVADATGRDLLRVDPAVRNRRDRPFGRSLEAMVRKRVDDAQAEFAAIEKRALALVSADQTDPSTKQAWSALSDRWGRTMQKLAAADLQEKTVPVLTRKVVPGDWLTSLVLTSPLIVDRGARRLAGVNRSAYLERLQPQLAFEPDGTMFGANEFIRHEDQRIYLGEELREPEAQTAFWAEVASRGGTLVVTPGHAVYLRAARVDGEPVFVLSDGMYGNLARQTPEQFARWARSSDARAHVNLFPHLAAESLITADRDVRTAAMSRAESRDGHDVHPAVKASGTDDAVGPAVRLYELTDAHGRDYGVGITGSVERGEVLLSAAAASTDHSERVVAVQMTDEDGAISRVEAVQDWAGSTDGSATRPVHVVLESEDGRFAATDPAGKEVHKLSPEAMADKVFATKSFRKAIDGPVRPPLILTTHETDPSVGRTDLNQRFLARLRELAGPWHVFEHSGRLTFERDFGVVGIDHGGRFTEVLPDVTELRFSSEGSSFAIASVSGDAASRAALLGERTPPLRGPWGEQGPIHVFLDGDEQRALAGMDHQDLELGGRAVGRLLLSDDRFKAQLEANPRRPVIVHSADSGSRNDIGGLGFDLAGSLHEAGFYPPVYGVKGGTEGQPQFVRVSRLRTGDLLSTDFHRPDGTLAARLVRVPGDEAVARRLRHWAESSTEAKLSTYLGRDGGRVRAPWDRAPVLIVAPRSSRGYLATRRDGKVGMVGLAALADVFRDDPVLRQGLGTDPDLPYLLVGLDGRTAGLASFAGRMARGGYARTAYAPRGALLFRPGGRLGLTGPGFRVAEPRPPRPRDIVSFESANERLGTFGQFFPSEDFDGAHEVLAALRESHGQQQYYIREVSRPDGRGGHVLASIPYRAPWAGRNPWFTSGHGTPAGLSFALLTGDLYRRGDVVSLRGAPAARVIFASEIYRRAQPDPEAGIVLGQCSVNLPMAGSAGPTAAFSIREGWRNEFGPTVLWAASNPVVVGRDGERTVEAGGAFFEAVAPGVVPDPPQPLLSGLGLFESDRGDEEPSDPLTSTSVGPPRPGGIRLRVDPTFAGFSDDDASETSSVDDGALFAQEDDEPAFLVSDGMSANLTWQTPEQFAGTPRVTTPHEDSAADTTDSQSTENTPAPEDMTADEVSSIPEEDEALPAEIAAMMEWSERIGAAHDRVAEREAAEPENVSQVRGRAEQVVGELPAAADGVDEEIHAFLHEGLRTLLTDVMLDGASLRQAWRHEDVAGLRQVTASLRSRSSDASLESTRDESERAIRTEAAEEPFVLQAVADRAVAQWAEPFRVTREWLAARAGQPEVEAARARAQRLVRSLPVSAPEADDAARRLLHDGLVSALTEAMAHGVSPRGAWETPAITRLREDAEALRGAVRGVPHYTTLPSRELGGLRDESPASTVVHPSGAEPTGQAVTGAADLTEDALAETTTTAAAEPGPREDPPRLRELIEEFERSLPEADAVRDSALHDEARRLLGERPAPEPGYGPSGSRQHALWQSAVEAVAAELARGRDGRDLAGEIRSRFEQVRTHDALSHWAEENLARFADDFAEAEVELRRETERSEASAERVLLARRQAEAMLGASVGGVPGGVGSRIRQEFHDGLLASLSSSIARGIEPEAAWNHLWDARLTAEDLRLTSRYLWGHTGFGRFPAEEGTGYEWNSLAEPVPPYSLEDPDRRFHGEVPPDYDDVVDLDRSAVHQGSLGQAADHLGRLFELARELPGSVLSPWRERMLRHLLPPPGLTLGQLDHRLAVHNVVLTAVAYQAYLDQAEPNGGWDTAPLLRLDPGDLAAFLPQAAHDQVRDHAFHTLRDAFEAAKYYAEPNSNPEERS
ncbi:hypothetical protein DMC64_20475 [Amycolatopsis sp. WAC 04197]|uniref:hypothetical protein n=1 Tax=Amycolatopsis sp. WAC 04197 TaxID=2203199 RepID=UPI000F7698EF|nr:hypothetical protein [Amycolatopsis sp. WAC 04197]RSN45214.1 hypothetical protein DMC64_20475 [Amycolatopsis sp. WAC 04197]